MRLPESGTLYYLWLQKPNVPTAYPNRKNKIVPKIVAVKKTGAVPNFLESLSIYKFKYIPRITLSEMNGH
jgi:hypothetical protein